MLLERVLTVQCQVLADNTTHCEQKPVDIQMPRRSTFEDTCGCSTASDTTNMHKMAENVPKLPTKWLE